LVTIVINDLQPYQIADVYYDTGDGVVKELGRFYGDENGTLNVIYDKGSDPEARVMIKLIGAGLPTTITPPPALPTPTATPTIPTTTTTTTTTAFPIILPPAEKSELPTIIVIEIVVLLFGIFILLTYFKWYRKRR